MRKETDKQQELGRPPGASHKPALEKVKVKLAKTLVEGEASQLLISKEYHNLAEV